MRDGHRMLLRRESNIHTQVNLRRFTSLEKKKNRDTMPVYPSSSHPYSIEIETRAREEEEEEEEKRRHSMTTRTSSFSHKSFYL